MKQYKRKPVKPEENDGIVKRGFARLRNTKHYCKKLKGEHDWVVQSLPNHKHPYYTNEWEECSWWKRGEERRYVIRICSGCNKEDFNVEYRPIDKSS